MKKILIAILCILILAGIGIGIYFGFYKKSEPVKKEYTQSDFQKIIKDELDILYGKMNLAIDDIEITIWAYHKGDFMDKETFSLKDMEKILNNSSLRDLKLKFTNLYDHDGNYSFDKDTVCATLDGGVYTMDEYNPCAHGSTTIYPIYSKVVDYKEENGKYIVTVKNVFTYGGDGGDANSYFYTYEDAINANEEGIEPFLTYEDDGTLDDAKNYIKLNWDTIEPNLDKYVYTFKVKDNAIVLVDYQREYAPDNTPKEDKVYEEMDNGGLLCEEKDINCYIEKFLKELSYLEKEDLKNPNDTTINAALFYYLRDIGNQNELFVYGDDCYYRIDKELLDEIVYIMFGKTDFNNYKSINELEGIFKIDDNTYEMRQSPKGGYRHTITNKDVEKISEDEYNIKLYFEGGSEDGVVTKSESATYHLKYNEDEEVFYVESIN